MLIVIQPNKSPAVHQDVVQVYQDAHHVFVVDRNHSQVEADHDITKFVIFYIKNCLICLGGRSNEAYLGSGSNSRSNRLST